jgi:hypothetical protein
MADEHEHDDVLGQASKSERDRRRAERGEQHPLRYQFEELYKRRTDLGGTPDYNRNWLDANIPKVTPFRGREKPSRGSREGAARGGADGAVPAFNINMVTMNNDRSDRSVTTNNYMGGRGFVDDGEPNWGRPGTEFQDAEVFEPMSHDLYNVRESGGGNWAGELGAGQTGIGRGDQDALGI